MNVINPYISAGPFEFGSVPDFDTLSLGDPSSVTKNRLGETVYDFNGFSVTTSQNAVVETAFLPTESVFVGSIDVFGDNSSFEKLCKLDGRPKESLGFIVLLKFGITMTGFHDGDMSQLAITAFEKGRWDRFKTEMRDYSA